MRVKENYHRLLEGRAPEGAQWKLAHYAALLERWSKTQSLIRFSSPEELVERHLLESLLPLPFLEKRGSLLDIGSGAGFPGIPLLCALPGWSGVLLEPRTKKWAFLRQVIRELDLDAEARREGFERHDGGNYSAICSRALGGRERMLEWAGTRLAPGASLFFWATEEEEGRLRGLSGWNVLGFAIDGLRRGRLIQMKAPAGSAGER